MNEDLKPRRWLLIVLIVLGLAILVVLINKIVTDKKEDKNSLFNQIKAANIKAYNGTFEMYQGTQQGLFVLSLMDEIITNNKTSSNLITVQFNDLTSKDADEIRESKKSIVSNSTYEISLDYDENGYINQVSIELIKEYKSNYEVSPSFFNAFFKDSTKVGISVMNLLDNVCDSNKKYEDHQITIIYGNTLTSNIEEIRNLKSSFNNWNDYNVWSDLDEDGYVYQIHIESLT